MQIPLFFYLNTNVTYFSFAKTCQSRFLLFHLKILCIVFFIILIISLILGGLFLLMFSPLLHNNVVCEESFIPLLHRNFRYDSNCIIDIKIAVDLLEKYTYIILYFSILLHCIVQWVLQIIFLSVCSFIVPILFFTVFHCMLRPTCYTHWCSYILYIWERRVWLLSSQCKEADVLIYIYEMKGSQQQ
jgi:hypothetical protein